MKTVVVVDDEKNYLLVLETLLSEEGYEVVATQDPLKALQLVEEVSPALVMTDMKMPGLSGMELLASIRKKKPSLPVIILTAFGSIETAVEAMKCGAFHYVLKPFQNEEIKLVVKRAMEMSELAEEKRYLDEELSFRLGLEGFVAESPVMKKVLGLMEQVAPARTTVLIEGESGTGKELVARGIHNRSPRSGKPFIAVNCGALSETLLESELFGHEKGAFTGAVSQKKGRFEMADGGTLFLDEVGTMSPALQVRLLRVLQEQVFERVGGTRQLHVDVRVLAAGNVSLKKLMEAGSFREDLYYRLNVFTIEIPPLRDRREDIVPLANYFIKLYNREMGKRIRSVSPEAVNILMRYPWPGNIRELKNAIERAVVVCKEEVIIPPDLPSLNAERYNRPDAAAERTLLPDLSKPLPDYLDQMEKEAIAEALRRADGVQAKAAKILGISPTSLQYKLNKYGL